MRKQEPETKRTKVSDANRSHLDRQYGNIGISAVAAAVRYVGDTKDSARGSAQHNGRRTRSVLAV